MLSPKQEFAIKNSVKRINLLEGAVRSGKTYSANILFVEQIFTIPYDKFLLTGKTKDTLRRNVTRDIMRLIGEKNCEYNAHMGELTIKVGKETKLIYCIGALDERSEGRIRGATFGGWYADERTLHPESFCDMARTRLSIPESKMIWTCNPDSTYHPVYTQYIKKPSSDLFHCQFELDDNLTLTEAFKRELKEKFTGIFYRRMIKGEWILADGIIYDMFMQMHIDAADDLPKITRYWVGIDYGTASVCVFLLFGLGVDGRVYVIDEWFHDAKASRKQLTNTEYRIELGRFIERNEVKVSFIACDPSATSFILELKTPRDGEFAGYTVIEANNDVLDGIRCVGNAFSQLKLFIHRRCKTLIDEITSSYCWSEKAQVKGEDKPLKKDDHRSDALRYGYMTYFLNSSPSISCSSAKPNMRELKKEVEIEPEEIMQFIPRIRHFGADSWLQRKRHHQLGR